MAERGGQLDPQSLAVQRVGVLKSMTDSTRIPLSNGLWGKDMTAIRSERSLPSACHLVFELAASLAGFGIGRFSKTLSRSSGS